jgi:hypothetical protein
MHVQMALLPAYEAAGGAAAWCQIFPDQILRPGGAM